jgi:sporulation protein YlmC with PRC-barrel domain
VELGRDVLDQQVIDRDGMPMGRVDGIVLRIRQDRPPTIARLVVGGPTPLRRISRGLARRVERWRRRWGPAEREGFEVPWRQVLKVGIDVKLDVEAERTPATAWERWVRDHIVSRIPGA